MTKIALITGAAGNLGKAVTAKLADAGFQVVGTIMPGQANQVRPDNQITYMEVDLMNLASVDKLLHDMGLKYGKINAIVCLVGGFDMASISKTTLEDLQQMIDLNFYTAFNIIKPALKLFKKQDRLANIVLISAKPAFETSTASQVFPYALSKSMLVKMAEMINADSKNLNAKAAIIVPSIIDTPPNREAMPDADFSDWVTPQSIAEKIAFICSDAGNDLQDTVLKIYGNS